MEGKLRAVIANGDLSCVEKCSVNRQNLQDTVLHVTELVSVRSISKLVDALFIFFRSQVQNHQCLIMK